MSILNVYTKNIQNKLFLPFFLFLCMYILCIYTLYTNIIIIVYIRVIYLNYT